MELTFLGTGGSQPIPLPTCDCDLCREARRHGAPYTRLGYSIYLPELDALIDASEFAPHNLNRWRVPRIDRLFLSHWHPDHAGGVRALGMRDPPTREGESPLAAKRRTAPTLVTTRAVYERARETIGVLGYYVDEGFVDLHLLDEEPFDADGVRVEAMPYPLEPGGPPDATGFLFRETQTDDESGDDKRLTDDESGDDERRETTLAVVTDDATAFDASQLPSEPDAVVFECGRFADVPPAAEADDLSHEAVRDRVARIDPDRAYLSHVGHQSRRSYDDLRGLERPDDPIRFAFDGLRVEL